MELYVRLNEILQERDMTQKRLSDITGLRPATISEICNNQRTTLNRDHLVKIISALNIKEINDLITIKKEEE